MYPSPPRSWQITTAEFGKKWGSFTHEKKLKLKSSIKKPAEFMTSMKEKLNFNPVEIIGTCTSLCLCWLEIGFNCTLVLLLITPT